MKFDAPTILIVVAMLLSVGALVKPSWPLLPVAVFLACVAFIVKFAS